jgi:hypothetical protein
VLPLRDDNPRHGPAVVTGLLLAANALVFVLMLGLDRSEKKNKAAPSEFADIDA